MNKIGKEDIYKLGIVFSLFLIIIILFIVFIYKKEAPSEIIEEDQNRFITITDYNTFFFVNNNINNFINYTATNNIEAILSFLDNQYKEDKNINRNTLSLAIATYKEGDVYQATLTKSFSINDKTEVYYTEGKITNQGFYETTIVKENISFLLYVDFENMATSLEMVENSFDANKFISEIDKKKEIALNTYNKVEQIDIIDYTTICSMYLSDFIWKVYNNSKEAFSLQTNFSSLESFETFINQNNITSEIKSCSQTDENGKRVYQMVDRNNYKYTFTEENIWDYKVSVNK